ncbi:MAG: hypothetical protein M4D80_26705 [Myxococcota bacterium]|nr:hypothetical protein [Deltaproteobacteria bacterium]MDQ3338773.1 hypothetical protein [Myxococcota bacterium]
MVTSHPVDFQLGSIPLTVRPLDRTELADLPARFTALVPCFEVTRLPATLAVLVPLLDAGCADVILAGPSAAAFEGQVVAAIAQQGVEMQTTAYDDLSDACNAMLLGALIHKGGVALVADEPELLDRLHGLADANGWMIAAPTTEPAETRPAAITTPVTPKAAAKVKAKPTAKAKAKARAKPKAKAAKAKPKAKAAKSKAKPVAKPKAKPKAKAKAKAKKKR